MLDMRQYPTLGVCLLAGFTLLTIWRLEHPSSSDSDPSQAYLTSPAPLRGPFNLILPGNVTGLPLPYQMDTLQPGDRGLLIDLNNFTFLMNDAAAMCNVTLTPLTIVTLVHSAPSHTSHRKAIRETWGSENMNVVFLLGETDNATQAMLEEENMRHRDLVQGSFLDSYRNLTYKHTMGLKWISYHCPTARYIVKTDDDVFVNVPNLNKFLSMRLSPLGARRLILCRLLVESVAKRTYRSKWRVTPAEYAGRWYPGYCPGWAVVYSPDVVFMLYREAQRTPYFWIDDVHITGTLVARANLTHTLLGKQQYLWSIDQETLEKYKNEYLFSLVEDTQIFQSLWEASSSSSLFSPSSSSSSSSSLSSSSSSSSLSSTLPPDS